MKHPSNIRFLSYSYYGVISPIIAHEHWAIIGENDDCGQLLARVAANNEQLRQQLSHFLVQAHQIVLSMLRFRKVELKVE